VPGVGCEGEEQGLVGDEIIEIAAKNPGSPAAARKLSRPRPARAKKRSSRARKVKTSIAIDSAAALVRVVAVWPARA